jgi:hypothetical protein
MIPDSFRLKVIARKSEFFRQTQMQFNQNTFIIFDGNEKSCRLHIITDTSVPLVNYVKQT